MLVASNKEDRDKEPRGCAHVLRENGIPLFATVVLTGQGHLSMSATWRKTAKLKLETVVLRTEGSSVILTWSRDTYGKALEGT